MNIFTCCVCGYLDLDETPYYEDFAGSNVICACCGFEYGVDDYENPSINYEALNDKEAVEKSHQLWRAEWIKNRCKVFDPTVYSPIDIKDGKLEKRKVIEQFKNINYNFDDNPHKRS